MFNAVKDIFLSWLFPVAALSCLLIGLTQEAIFFALLTIANSIDQIN